MDVYTTSPSTRCEHVDESNDFVVLAQPGFVTG